MTQVCEINMRREAFKRGLALAGLAREIGVSDSALRLIDQGKRPGPEVAKKVADYFERDVLELFPMPEAA